MSLLGTTTVTAQVNTEALAAEVKRAGPQLVLAGGGGFASGNVELVEWRGDLAFDHATAHPQQPSERFWFRDRSLLHGNVGQKRVGGTSVVNTGFGHARYTRMQWPQFGVEGYGQAQYDEQRLLQWRALVGAGVRAVGWNTPRFGLWGGTGYMAEWEKREAGVQPRRVLNHRFSSYLTIQALWLPDRLSFVATAYIQPRFGAFADLQVLQETQFRFLLTDALRFSIDGSLRHDSRPPEGVKPTDLRVGASLTLTLRPSDDDAEAKTSASAIDERTRL